MSGPITFRQYELLRSLLKYKNFYRLHWDRRLCRPVGDDRWQPVTPEPPFSEVPFWANSKDVQWALDEGLAEYAETDPLLAGAKIVPTDRVQSHLDEHKLTKKSKGVGVHLEHCCTKPHHGCKYDDEFCPVATGLFRPRHSECGVCYEEDLYEGTLTEEEQ